MSDREKLAEQCRISDTITRMTARLRGLAQDQTARSEIDKSEIVQIVLMQAPAFYASKEWESRHPEGVLFKELPEDEQARLIAEVSPTFWKLDEDQQFNWCARIMPNKVRDAVKRKRPLSFREGEDFVDEAKGVDWRSIVREDRRVTELAAGILGEAWGEILALVMEGHDVPAIAAELGVKADKVYKAKANLKAMVARVAGMGTPYLWMPFDLGLAMHLRDVEMMSVKQIAKHLRLEATEVHERLRRGVQLKDTRPEGAKRHG